MAKHDDQFIVILDLDRLTATGQLPELHTALEAQHG